MNVPTLAPEEYARRVRETCHREVTRRWMAEPCDQPAPHLAHDPEDAGEFPSTRGFYPACERHRMRGPVALTLAARPELADLDPRGAVMAWLTEGRVSAA